MLFVSLLAVFLRMSSGRMDESWLADAMKLASFAGSASQTSLSLTALALNEGNPDWFYLTEWAKYHAQTVLVSFEEKVGIPFAKDKPSFFCSTLLYLQGAAMAMHQDSDKHLYTLATGIESGSVAATVSALIDSYSPAAAGYCVQLFPAVRWRHMNAPCEKDDADHVTMYSIACDVSADFDYRLITSGFRPGGVSAFSAYLVPAAPASQRPACHEQHNTDMAIRVLGMMLQLPFTQLMVAPVGAMLTMSLQDLCPGGAAFDGKCLGFTNVMDLFFESMNACASLYMAIQSDLACLLFRHELELTDVVTE